MSGDGDSSGRMSRHTAAATVRAGIEAAAPALSDQAPGHIDRLRVRVPRGATPDQVSRAIARVARREKDRSG